MGSVSIWLAAAQKRVALAGIGAVFDFQIIAPDDLKQSNYFGVFMASLAELLGDVRPDDVVLPRADGGINVVAPGIVQDPQNLLARATLLLAYSKMYLGEPIIPSDIAAAAQALPRGENDVQRVLEGYNEYFGGPEHPIKNPLLRQSFLDTVAHYGGSEGDLGTSKIERRIEFSRAAAYLIKLVG